MFQMKERLKKKVKGKIILALLPYLLPVIVVLLVLVIIVGGTLKSTTGSSGSLLGNAATIYSYLKANIPNATDEGIAGILGNFQVESGLDSSSIQDHVSFDDAKARDPSVSGYALGLGQEDGGRRVKLLEYADKEGKEWSDLTLQLEQYLNDDGSKDILKQIASETDVDQAADDFNKKWEVSAGDSSPRQKAAEAFLAQIQSGTLGSVGAGMPSSNVPDGYSVSDPAPNTNFSGDPYPYGQCTWYVWGRALQLGIHFSPTMGNGGDWDTAGYPVTNNPTLHAAVSFDPGVAGAGSPYGHVAFVEQVRDDGSILVSESNFTGPGGVGGLGIIDYRVFSAADAGKFQYVIGN